jgi:hypothetical protein
MLLKIVSFYSIVLFVDIINLYQLSIHNENMKYTMLYSYMMNIVWFMIQRSVPIFLFIFPNLSTIWWLCIVCSLTNTMYIWSLCLHLYCVWYLHDLAGFWSTVLCFWVPNIISYICILSHNNIYLESVHIYFLNVIEIYIVRTLCNNISPICLFWYTKIANIWMKTNITYILRIYNTLPITNIWYTSPAKMHYNMKIKSVIISNRKEKQQNQTISTYRWILESMYAPGGIWYENTNVENIWNIVHNNVDVIFRVCSDNNKNFTVSVSPYCHHDIIANYYKQQFNKHILSYIHFLNRVYRMMETHVEVGNKVRTLICTLLSPYITLQYHNDTLFSYDMSHFKYLAPFKKAYHRNIHNENWLCDEKDVRTCFEHIYKNNPVKLDIIDKCTTMIDTILVDILLVLTQLRIMYLHISTIFPISRHDVFNDVSHDIFTTLTIYQGKLLTQVCVEGMCNDIITSGNTTNDHIFLNPMSVWPVLNKKKKKKLVKRK